MATSSSRHGNLSYQIVPRHILDKIAKFGSAWFNFKENVKSVQSQPGHSPPYPPLQRSEKGQRNFFFYNFFYFTLLPYIYIYENSLFSFLLPNFLLYNFHNNYIFPEVLGHPTAVDRTGFMPDLLSVRSS